VKLPDLLSPSILAPSEGIQCVPGDIGLGSNRGTWDGPVRHSGREAALDLIEEHLTDSIFHAGYRPGEHLGRLQTNWNFPSEWTGPTDSGYSYVLKVQSFALGGYEASVRSLNIPKIGASSDSVRPTGKREAPEILSAESIMKGAARGKRRVRHLCRNMMATHLLTLSKREGPNTTLWGLDRWESWNNGGRYEWERLNGAFWTPEEWAAAWDRLRRLLVRVIGQFPYVAILEQHKKGNYHLHVAWVGKINVTLIRKMWLSIVGQGNGNIDAKYIKVPPGHDRSSRIARYISKYVSKSFEDNPRFNKKRYWASKQSLEEARRYVLRADTLEGAMDEVKRLLGLDYGMFLVPDRATGRMKFENLFWFPDGTGAWINYLPDLHSPDVPF
jgi:hypothetical protein